MSDINKLLAKLLDFRERRDWRQFHKIKDMFISLNLEAAELLEHVQWKDEEQFKTYLIEHREQVEDEVADVFNWLLLIANDLNIDLLAAANNKLLKNEKKYPISECHGKSKKYTEY